MTKISWLHKNLFNTWYNSLLTVLSLILIFWITKGILTWAFTQAQWQVIQANIHLFLVGRYPQTLYWRIWIILFIVVTLSIITWAGFTGLFISKKISQSITPWLSPLWLLSFPIIWWLIGGGLGLESVSTNLWNGLLLTLLMAAVSIVLSFPMGVLLALGRTSNLPVVRWFSILYIEIIRGVPLIGILFLAQVMLPLFLPSDLRLDRLLRGIAGLVLFSAAYMAENVRGGLQSIPREQIEAAKALGLNPPLIVILIILPQALRAVIPAIVGQFIGLFKDTSLLSLVGLVELTGIARSILAQPRFLGRYAEVYIFIGFIYWLFCYSMSLAARKLERQLSNNH
ncbi:polar amino acid ABC transporter, inner membrane subunit [Richelia sinica FACHB-800]|uniref:Polar amino acid ABC transporter, inner membrane subunit n=1 Tax=Richelia sinica FACHB-800 TaxID=1357546 RepID=A0A975T7W3_9NOST|nr:amino acid ABC transporter permease [Richelia sinica]MBD2665239.1 amino acid ABC transporter permease [Richelia sinica FACHB-800]QXE23695.1 polar amino acid ABC transporter, inner membrane subunit [Richelia sinica FACHB-800]